MSPLFEVRMELSEGRVQYQPSLEVGVGDSFLVLVEGLLRDTEAVAASMPRLLEGAISYKVSARRAAAPSSAGRGEGGRVPARP